MSYVAKSLGKGETVRYVATLHWVAYVGPLFTLLLGVVVFAASASAPSDGAAVGGLAGFALFLMGLLRLPMVWLERLTTELGITSRKVIGKWGVISRRTIEQRLDKIDSVQVDQSVVGRVLGYGTVRIHGSGTSTTPIPRISNPIEFRRQVGEALEAMPSGAKVI